MIKSSNIFNLHPLMERKNGNKILDYRLRTRIDENFIPQLFNNKIVFQSFESFQQNNLFLSKRIHKYVKQQIRTRKINAIGGESYLYDDQKDCCFYTNSKSIVNDANFNGYKNTYYIDYNKDSILFKECDTVLNVSRLSQNILKQVNNSSSNRLIIINCHHKDFWNKIKILSNYKLIIRKKFIDTKANYFITVNVLVRKSFISLGGNCAVTYNLKKFNLRNQAFPFDWSQNKITQVINALEMNFKDFEKVKIQKYSENHSSYLVKNNYMKFAHEVIRDVDLATFQSKLIRRIERIRIIKNPVFIRLETFQYKNRNIYQTYWKELIIILNKYYTNYKIILISKINPKLLEIDWYPYDSFSEDWKNEHLDWNRIFSI